MTPGETDSLAHKRNEYKETMMNTQSKNHERVFGFSVIGPQYRIVPESEVTETKASGPHKIILD